MSLAANIQITDQDVYTQSSVTGAEKLGQVASTPSGKVFRYSVAGGALVAGQITQPLAVTANYANRTLTTAAPLLATQITVPLGTTAAQDLFVGYYLVVVDGTGKGQGAYYINGNTAATAGNSNTTVVEIRGALSVALDTTSVVTIIPSQQTNTIQHTAALAIPVGGVPVIAITSGYFHWEQVGGMASVLSDGAITKNANAVPSASVAGAVAIQADANVVNVVGYAPELTVDTKYSPLVLTMAC